MNRTLLILGAGPKALAIHVRAKVLRALGYDAPHVAIIERADVGANWAGKSGFTDGSPPLVTSPERDVGFPYKSEHGPHVDLEIARHSWHAFMVAERGLAAWVDGDRELPTHSRFAEYLRWVARMSGANIIHGEVVREGIRLEGHDWLVAYRQRAKQQLETLRAGAIVITGPGKPTHLVDGQDEHFNVSDGETFWLPVKMNDFRRLAEGDIAVVGSGDTAASVVVALLDALPPRARVTIDIFCKKGMLSPRIEGAGEVKWWTDPGRWNEIPPAGRSEYIWRTERGVCSKVFKSRIDAAPNVKLRPGMVRAARMDGKKVTLTVEDHEGNRTLSSYKRLIVAIGFRRWDFQTLFRDQSIFPTIDKDKHGQRWENVKERQMSERIQQDLSYDCQQFETPKLYVPALAGLNRGPGFPNLGCLGIMSERIIESYLTMLRK